MYYHISLINNNKSMYLVSFHYLDTFLEPIKSAFIIHILYLNYFRLHFHTDSVLALKCMLTMKRSISLRKILT